MRLLAIIALTGCSFTGAAISHDDAALHDASAPGDGSAPPADAPMTDAATPSDAAPPTCATAYPTISPAGHHYKVLSNKTWDAAKTGCNDMGHLVKIEGATENQFVAGLTGGFYWIGLKDVAGNEIYKWTDGTGVTFNGFGGSPSASSNDCVDADSNGTWSPFDCTFQHAAICECE